MIFSCNTTCTIARELLRAIEIEKRMPDADPVALERFAGSVRKALGLPSNNQRRDARG